MQHRVFSVSIREAVTTSVHALNEAAKCVVAYLIGMHVLISLKFAHQFPFEEHFHVRAYIRIMDVCACICAMCTAYLQCALH